MSEGIRSIKWRRIGSIVICVVTAPIIGAVAGSVLMALLAIITSPIWILGWMPELNVWHIHLACMLLTYVIGFVVMYYFSMDDLLAYKQSRHGNWDYIITTDSYHSAELQKHHDTARHGTKTAQIHIEDARNRIYFNNEHYDAVMNAIDEPETIEVVE